MALCLSLLTGCGFQLRGVGADAEHVQPLRLAFERADLPLARRVAEALTDAGVPTHGTAATPLARVVDISESRRGRSLTQGIQVAEYELMVQLTLYIEAADGAQILAPTTLSAHRVYVRDTVNLLTNETEEAVLWDELRADVAQQVVRMLATNLKRAS